jgi:hypothetical protein
MKRAIHFVAISLLLLSCNVFNPSGSGDLSGSGADGYILQGQEDLRNRDFAAARRNFDKALSIDSTKSLAWHGLGKSYVGGLPMDSVLSAFQKLTKNTDSLINPFGSASDSLINAIYRPIARMTNVYALFIARDTTGRTDGILSSNNDMLNFTIGKSLVLAISPMILSKDSLMDSRSKLGNIGRQLTQALNVDSLTKGGAGSLANTVGDLVLQVDSSTCVTDAAGATSCKKDTTGKFDSTAVDALNAKFVQMGTDLGSIQSAAAALGATSSDSTSSDTSTNSEVTQQAQDFVKSNPDAVKLVQFADGLDNDGNGCVDEKVSDGKDGMGDGVPGDYRMGYRDTSFAVEPGNLAINTQPDGLHDSRLVDITTDTLVNGRHLNRGIKGTSTNAPLIYADQAGHLEFARPYWDSTHADFPVKRWIKTLNWTMAEALADSIPVLPKLDMSAMPPTSDAGRALTPEEMVTIRLRIVSVNDMSRRLILGRKYVGGCWLDVKDR